MNDQVLLIATTQKLSDPDHDMEPLLAACSECGIVTDVQPWEAIDPKKLGRKQFVLLRSTWDYWLKPDAFLHWTDALSFQLINSASVVRYNYHKRYLHDLDENGFATVPTLLVPQGSAIQLWKLLAKQNWATAVAKPAIGGGSFHVRHVSSADESWWAERLADADMLLQPVVESVREQGEVAVVCIDGVVSHAVRKRARFSGDEESVVSEPLDPELHALATRVCRYIERRLPGGRLLYTRVDAMRGAHGEWLLSEVEMIEPSLYFAHQPGAALGFARALQSRLL